MVYVAKWKVVVILVLCALGIVYAAPNLLSRRAADSLPGWLPHKQISLGLDLQGGSHLLLEVETQSVIRDRLNGLVDEVRSALVKQRIGYTGLGVAANGVGFTLRNPADADKAREAVRNLDPDTTLQVTGNRMALNLTERALRDRTSAAVDQSIEIVRRRIDATGVREPTIQREGTDRILVELPGVGDPDRIKKLIGKTAKLTFQMVDVDHSPEEAEGGHTPPGDELLPLDKPTANGKPQMFLVHRRVMVSGDTLVDAQPSFQDNQPVVSFRFDAVGARRFADATKANVGKPFAIVLDNKVISAPVIREPILGGSGIITGGFTVQEAQDLALLLRAGALPAPLKVLEERTVGPGMGADSIRAGEIACVAGMAIVVVFMVVVYGLFGLMACVALVFNLFLIVALLSLLQATLTLPGIAGIVLTVGMAVDANVLIYERMREEQRNGRTPISAIDAGFQRAFGTIIDSNLTTLIAAALLYNFGSGPVKGFGVTLAIGILTSMFTAIWVTRLLVIGWMRRTRPKALPL
jgi:preprotein translocase subunit SecD